MRYCNGGRISGTCTVQRTKDRFLYRQLGEMMISATIRLDSRESSVYHRLQNGATPLESTALLRRLSCTLLFAYCAKNKKKKVCPMFVLVIGQTLERNRRPQSVPEEKARTSYKLSRFVHWFLKLQGLKDFSSARDFGFAAHYTARINTS